VCHGLLNHKLVLFSQEFWDRDIKQDSGDVVGYYVEANNCINFYACHPEHALVKRVKNTQRCSKCALLDLETTGPPSQQIVQVGAWEMFTNSIFESLAKPAVAIDFQHGSLVHKIFDRHVADKPGWEEVGKKFQEWVESFQGKQIVFISHGKCDPRWLKTDSERVGLSVPGNWTFVDSIDLAHKLLGPRTSVSLESLSQRYGIHRTHIHRALPDILYTWRFIKEMVAEVSTTHPFTTMFNFAFHREDPHLNLQPAQQPTGKTNRRRPYNCRRCNVPKKGHTCPN